jgi:hypothetical protein
LLIEWAQRMQTVTSGWLPKCTSLVGSSIVPQHQHSNRPGDSSWTAVCAGIAPAPDRPVVVIVPLLWLFGDRDGLWYCEEGEVWLERYLASSPGGMRPLS